MLILDDVLTKGSTMQMVATKKKEFYVPIDLIRRADKVARAEGTTWSDLCRMALENYVTQLEQAKLEKEIEEACKNYRTFNKEFASEWAQYETRIE